jgi:hypothetical protein
LPSSNSSHRSPRQHLRRPRFDIALLLAKNDRAGDALHYARAALANFQQVGPGASAMASQATKLIQHLERGTAL